MSPVVYGAVEVVVEETVEEVVVEADLKFVATVTTGGRVKIFQIV